MPIVKRFKEKLNVLTFVHLGETTAKYSYNQNIFGFQALMLAKLINLNDVATKKLIQFDFQNACLVFFCLKF